MTDSENDCPFCGMDDSVVPSWEDVVEQILSEGCYALYMERRHKLTFHKGGELKLDGYDPFEDTKEFTRLMQHKWKLENFAG